MSLLQPSDQMVIESPALTELSLKRGVLLPTLTKVGKNRSATEGIRCRTQRSKRRGCSRDVVGTRPTSRSIYPRFSSGRENPVAERLAFNAARPGFVSGNRLSKNNEGVVGRTLLLPLSRDMWLPTREAQRMHVFTRTERTVTTWTSLTKQYLPGYNSKKVEKPKKTDDEPPESVHPLEVQLRPGRGQR